MRPRVLVVDDSAFARTVLARLLRAADIDVIGTARDGRDALERIDMLDPDVITLDITMPDVDGLDVLRALRGRTRPRVIVVSVSSIDTDLGAEALALGAIDLVAKPTALASDRLNEIGEALVARVLAASAAVPEIAPMPAASPPARRANLVMVGTSTGGPQALTALLAGLPADFAAPIAMALHIPAGYTDALAHRLDKLSKVTVVEARDGMELLPGIAALAPGGMHLRIERGADGMLRARIASSPARQFRPSVDELFESGVAAAGARALGVVLTGMGDDGLAGARLIARAGGSLLTEAASTCVVYGMPRSVYEADLGARAIPLDGMAEEIVKYV
jgi:two-component system chemotaxis response regulator CheB